MNKDVKPKATDEPAEKKVIREVKLHDVNVGIDWLRFTLPAEQRVIIMNKLVELLGHSIDRSDMPHRTKFLRYRNHYQFLSGSTLAYDEQRADCCVELSGKACKQLGSDKMLNIITLAKQYSAKFTRIDLFVDFRNQQLDLVNQVLQSCENKELCRCKTYAPSTDKASDTTLKGKSISLGQRGTKGSGRYVRIYDKGLQTGTQNEGQWERWETEFSSNAANQVCESLLASSNWATTACELALGAVEFRENTGAKLLARRPLAPWWENLTQNYNLVRVVTRRPKTTLETWSEWMRRCVIPSLHTMAKESNKTIEQVLADIACNQDLAKSLNKSSSYVMQYLSAGQCLAPTDDEADSFEDDEEYYDENWFDGDLEEVGGLTIEYLDTDPS